MRKKLIMSELPYNYRIVVGDWSDDGHRSKDFIRFWSSHKREDIIKAYKEGVEICGVGLHYRAPISVFCDNDFISRKIITKLESHSISFKNLTEGGFEENWRDDKDGLIGSPQSVVWLFFEIVRLCLPSFEYKFFHFTKDTFDCINGFWQDDFNHSMGYGVMSDDY